MTLVDTTGPFAEALEAAAAEMTSGCLHVTDAAHTRSGRAYLTEGKVYAVHVDGFLPKVLVRLRTGGMLSQEAFDDVLEAVGGDVFATNAAQVAVDRGYIEKDLLNAVYTEITLSAAGAICSWGDLQARVSRDAQTSALSIAPVSVATLAKALARRREHWDKMWREISDGTDVAHAYPHVDPTHPVEADAPSEVLAVIGACTGDQNLDAVAGECGLTRFETGHVLSVLVSTGAARIAPTPQPPAATGTVTRNSESVPDVPPLHAPVRLNGIIAPPLAVAPLGAVAPAMAPRPAGEIAAAHNPTQGDYFDDTPVALIDGSDDSNINSTPPNTNAPSVTDVFVGTPPRPPSTHAPGAPGGAALPPMPGTTTIPAMPGGHAPAVMPLPPVSEDAERRARDAAEEYAAAHRPSVAPVDHEAAAVREAEAMAAEAVRRHEHDRRAAVLADAEAALAQTDEALAEATAAAAQAEAYIAANEDRAHRAAQHLTDAHTDRQRLSAIAGNARLAHQQLDEGLRTASQEHQAFEEALRLAQERRDESANHIATVQRHVQDAEARASAAISDLARCGERLERAESEVAHAQDELQQATRTARESAAATHALTDRVALAAAEVDAARAALNALTEPGLT